MAVTATYTSASALAVIIYVNGASSATGSTTNTYTGALRILTPGLEMRMDVGDLAKCRLCVLMSPPAPPCLLVEQPPDVQRAYAYLGLSPFTADPMLSGSLAEVVRFLVHAKRACSAS